MKPLEELLEIAKSATPGEWPISYSEGFDYSESFAVSQGPDLLKEKSRDVYETVEGIKARQQMRLDAKHIATFNPQTVIDLITQLKDAQVEIKSLSTFNTQFTRADKRSWGGLYIQVEQLEQRLKDAQGENKKSYDTGFGDGWENGIVPWKSRVQKLEQRLTECETALKKALEFGEYADWAIDADKNLQQLDIDSRAYLTKWGG